MKFEIGGHQKLQLDASSLLAEHPDFDPDVDSLIKPERQEKKENKAERELTESLAQLRPGENTLKGKEFLALANYLLADDLTARKQAKASGRFEFAQFVVRRETRSNPAQKAEAPQAQASHEYAKHDFAGVEFARRDGTRGQLRICKRCGATDGRVRCRKLPTLHRHESSHWPPPLPQDEPFNWDLFTYYGRADSFAGLRSSWRLEVTSPSATFAMPPYMQDEVAKLRERLTAVWRALTGLPWSQQRVLRGYYDLGLRSDLAAIRAAHDAFEAVRAPEYREASAPGRLYLVPEIAALLGKNERGVQRDMADVGLGRIVSDGTGRRRRVLDHAEAVGAMDEFRNPWAYLAEYAFAQGSQKSPDEAKVA